MTVQVLRTDAIRKRKPHRKSRRGCGGCKLRRVRCDENKPECDRCVKFGVSCSYGTGSCDLESSLAGSFQVEIPKSCSVNKTIINMINACQDHTAAKASNLSAYHLNQDDLAVLQRFQYRTVFCVGTDKSVYFYRDSFIKLASSSPFLMHLVLTLTMMHDRYLTGEKQSASEAYHWYQGAAMFNSVLSEPLDPDHRDALWGAAAMLGCISFQSVDATTPQEAWPLKPPSAYDLDWLKISDGKKAVWKMADPLRHDSVFAPLKFEHATHYLPDDGNFEDLPAGFIELFELEDQSSPYYDTALSLARILDIDCNRRTVLYFMSFIGHVNAGFKKLLELKEKRALLMMAYWYAKMCYYDMWWTVQRVVLECQATCIYLETYYGDDEEIQRLLRFPKEACGLAR